VSGSWRCSTGHWARSERILDEWPSGASVTDYLTEAVADPTSALLVSAERALAAEFPLETQARRVLGAVEPVIRESLRRLSGGILPDGTNVIGGYWTRTNDPEIDIVGELGRGLRSKNFGFISRIPSVCVGVRNGEFYGLARPS
jgi:hypothetical protein